MRSDKGSVGGRGAAVPSRGAGGRDRLGAAVETQLPWDPPRSESEKPPAPSCAGGGDAGKAHGDKKTALSKVVIRRLPPSLTKEQLEQQLCPLPAHDYFQFFTADFSLSPHLYSRAYINFRNPDDILLFRDRFDGYIFIDSKGLEYPAVVEFAPFQKIARKKLRRKDGRTGSLEDDPDYQKFLETYCVEEEKTAASPETLLGDIEAKTRELIARRTTPLLEYIRNRKLEKQRIREEKRERRRRELEKKRLREEEKRKRREEERCQRKEASKQKNSAEKEVRIKLLKKPVKGDDAATEAPQGGAAADIGGGRREPCPSCAAVKPQPLQGSVEQLSTASSHLPQDNSEEQRDMEGKSQDEVEMQRCHSDGGRRLRAHYEVDTFSRNNEEEPKWGKGIGPDRGKKGGQDSIPVEAPERPGREQSGEGPEPKEEHVGKRTSHLCSCTRQEFGPGYASVAGDPGRKSKPEAGLRLRSHSRLAPPPTHSPCDFGVG